jgi:hypothetical protein
MPTKGGIMRRLVSHVALAVLLWMAALAQAAVTPVQLVSSSIGVSVWDTDPTMVGVAMQVVNVGTGTAENVRITAVRVAQGGSYQGPDPLPLSLGTIQATKDKILSFQVRVPRADGTRYLVTISGVYQVAGASYGFTLNRAIAPQPPAVGPIAAQSGSATIWTRATANYPPRPLPDDLGPNAETPILIPPGPSRPLLPPFTPPSSAGPLTPSGAVAVRTNTTHSSAGVPPDPSTAATAGGVVLSTYNTGLAYSLNGGATFTDLNLTPAAPAAPFFPEDDGGLCCDQVVIYLPLANIFVWLLQYNPVTMCTANCPATPPPPPPPPATIVITQPNRLRVAWATPQAIAANFATAWRWVDLTANARPGVSSGLGTANDEWLDYPDLAFSDAYLYVGVDHGTKTPGSVYTGRRILARLSLADMLLPGSATVRYDVVEPSGANGINKSHFVQGAPQRMVIAGLANDSMLWVYTWKDSESSLKAAIVPISKISTDYTAAAPDGQDWYAASFPGNVTGATYRSAFTFIGQPRRDEYLFAFDAGRNFLNNRPWPYVRVQTLEPFLQPGPFGGVTETYRVIGEQDIWSGVHAYGMAGLGTQDENIGLTVAAGGGTLGYPQFGVGYLNDGEVALLTASNTTQVPNRFGDYVNVRPIPGTLDFATEIYDVLQATPPLSCGTGGCNAVMRYVRFGRPPPTPPK